MSTEKNGREVERDLREWNREERLVAYALGELEGEDARRVEAELAGDAEAEALVARTRELAGVLETSMRSDDAESGAGLSDLQRANIARAASAARSPRPIGVFGSWRSAAAILVTVGAATAGWWLLQEENGSSDAIRVASSVDSKDRETALRLEQRADLKESLEKSGEPDSKWVRELKDLGLGEQEIEEALQEPDGGREMVRQRFHLLSTSELHEVQSLGYLDPSGGAASGAGPSALAALGYVSQAESSAGDSGAATGGGGKGGRRRLDLDREAYQRLEALGYTTPDPSSSTSGGLDLTIQESKRAKLAAGSVASSEARRGEAEVRRLYESEAAPTTLESLERGARTRLDDAAVFARSEGYDAIPENDFVAVDQDSRSTFSIDVDTASYANLRRMLRSGSLPPPGAVRIEEMLNYFRYDYPEPEGGSPFAVVTEVAACPWNEEHHLVHVGVQGRHTPEAERADSNLVFLIDVSGSMSSEDKLPLLKSCLREMTEHLLDTDRVAIVVYASATGLVLDSTPCSQRSAILAALDRLSAGGSTNGSGGIQLAYQVAQEHFLEHGINRVILATDGDFNVGISDRSQLDALIQEKARSGVFLSVLGFGTGNLKDGQLEMLADHGNGHYAYVDSTAEGRRILVDARGATLETIAKDVKIQVEFNPLLVESFRLIGYEKRALAHQDFTDDTKDAGEVGAGHSVTALYEIVPRNGTLPVAVETTNRYQDPPRPSAAAHRGELLNVALRYQPPEGGASTLIEQPVLANGQSFWNASDDFRFSSAVALFGMLLRHSKYAGAADLGLVRRLAHDAVGDDPGGWRKEFLELVGLAEQH